MKLNHDIFFKMLADATRLRALMLLQREGELCVCELTHALNLSQPKISRHLARLRESGVVRVSRDGLWMYYRINPSLPQWAINIFEQALDGTGNHKQFKQDFKRLCSMAGRRGSACCA
jgi:ArsR family transcriptional regulator